MAKNNETFVTQIARRDMDFPQWYTDVVLKTDMVDYSDVRGCMVIKAYGYTLWEQMQQKMDARFKKTGHKNAYFPMLIPESLLTKEAEHVEGFAPECAWVTYGGSEKLAERLAIRPTSETIICSMYSRWIQSYRDLPLKLNQWCNVMRWEKTSRPFLRTCAFLWQEGHTAHATFDEAQAETLQQLDCYRDFMENELAIPVILGRKTEKEKFAGAYATYTLEAMMQDGKALQMGTSHNLGDHFARAYNIQYLSKEGKLEYCYTTSWGTSTRMIGGLIMVHGDDRGLVMPPRVAPIQVVVLPIAMHKEGVLSKAAEITEKLRAAGFRVEMDDRDQSPGWKFNEWEMKGVPCRIEVGPRDIEQGVGKCVRRDTLEKFTLPMEGLGDALTALLDDIHATMFRKALAFREQKTVRASTYEELKAGIQNGFVLTNWCGETECENAIKADCNATTRCMPFGADEPDEGAVCPHCGKPAKTKIYFAKAY